MDKSMSQYTVNELRRKEENAKKDYNEALRVVDVLRTTHKRKQNFYKSELANLNKVFFIYNSFII